MRRSSYGAVPVVIGRILLALIFILSGLEKIFAWNSELAYLTSRGMPATGFFLFVALLIELIGGLMLLFGIKPGLAAGVLFLYLIPVTVVMHGFWTVTDPAMHAVMQDMMVHFFKNVAIMGGLLAVVGYEAAVRAARFSHDEKRDETTGKSEAA